jgi:putative membrane protein
LDAKLWFWTGALATLAAVVACGIRGVRAIRAGDVARHRRAMVAGALLVGLFLACYVVKVRLLGVEDRSTWTALDHAILYTHELCVAVMLGAGAVALSQAWRFRRALGAPPRIPADPAALPGRAVHRFAGRIAAGSGLLAFLTAIGVWAGMVLRA